MFRRAIIIISLALVVNSVVIAQSFTIQKYTLEDGLPNQVVYDLAQDSSGILWFVSEKGIYTYDAYEWKMRRPVGEQLKNFYRYVEIDQFGKKWFCPWYTDIEFYSYQNDRWHVIPPKPNMYRNSVNSFAVYSDSIGTTLSAATRNGTFFYNSGKWQVLTSEDGLPETFSMSVFAKDGQFLVGTVKGPALVKNQKVDRAFFANIEIPDGIIVATYIDKPDSAYRYWLLGNDWIGYVKNSKFHLVDDSFSFPMYNIKMEYFIISDGRNRIYIGNQAASYWIDIRYNKLTPLSNDIEIMKSGVTNAINDREDNIWLSSRRGLIKIKSSPFLNYYTQDGLIENEVSSIKAFNNGDMVIGHNNGLSFMSQGKIKKTINYFDGLTNHSRFRILDAINKNDTIFLAGSDKGIGAVDNKFNLKWIIKDNDYHFATIAEDCNGNILTAGNDGLFVFDGKNIKRIKMFKLLTKRSHYVRKLLFDNDCNLMAATMNSGFLISGIPGKNNLNGSNALSSSVYDYCIVNPNLKLAATADGLYKEKEGRLIRAYLNGQTITNPIYFIYPGYKDDIWFGTNNGVEKWNGREIIHYGLEDGVSGLELNRDAAYLDKNNNFWFGTDRGLSCYIPEYDNARRIKPYAQFANLEDASGKKFRLDKDIYLESTQNNIWVHYRGLTFIDESKTTYYLTIHNIETGSEDSVTTTLTNYRFSNLPAGQYYFTLKVRNVKGILSNPVRSSVLTIHRPFYNQLWFYFLVAIFGGAFVYLIVDIYYSRKQSRELEEKVNERTEELIKSEKKYRQLVETAQDAIISTDDDLNIITWNESAERIYGYKKEEVIGKNFVTLTRLAYKNFGIGTITERLQKAGLWNGEIVQYSKSGNRMDVFVSASVFSDYENSVAGIVGVLRDVTQLKKLEKDRSFAIMNSVEKERDRISKDLHDDLGQILTSVVFKLETFGYKLRINDSFYTDSIELIRKAGKELRNIVHNLHPVEIDKDGLGSAIDLLIFQNQKISGTKIELIKDEYNNDLDKQSELMLYRIIQEAISNALKHANANLIKVSLERFNNSLLIMVLDNGIGFNLEKALEKREDFSGNGLINIQQRVELLGGELSIHSEENVGTKLKVKINLN